MSRDGWLPPGVESYMLPGNRPEDDHDERCPAHPDAPPTYSECDNVGRCGCWGSGFIGWLYMLLCGPCPINTDPPCECDELRQADADSAVEDSVDAEREGW